MSLQFLISYLKGPEYTSISLFRTLIIKLSKTVFYKVNDVFQCSHSEKLRFYIGKWLIQKQVTQTAQGRCEFFLGVGGFWKILRNLNSGSWQMLTSNYKVGGWGDKRPKTCLRNI